MSEEETISVYKASIEQIDKEEAADIAHYYPVWTRWQELPPEHRVRLTGQLMLKSFDYRFRSRWDEEHPDKAGKYPDTMSEKDETRFQNDVKNYLKQMDFPDAKDREGRDAILQAMEEEELVNRLRREEDRKRQADKLLGGDG